MLTILKRSITGILAGYAGYLLLVGILIVIEKFRFGFSRGENFYVIFFPFLAPNLLSPLYWHTAPLEDNLLILTGGLSLAIGLIWTNCRRSPKSTQDPHL